MENLRRHQAIRSRATRRAGLPRISLTLSSGELSANLSAAPPFHTRWLLYAVLRKQQNKAIRNCMGTHSRETDAIARKIEKAALVQPEKFSPNPGVHIASATRHTALVIGSAL
jgi:hypothetical protein